MIDKEKILKNGMVDREDTITDLEINIRWIEDIPAHQFAGWQNVTGAMQKALNQLKEQEAQRQKCLQTLADNQIAISGADPLTDYEQGKWDGLQVAFEILSASS